MIPRRAALAALALPLACACQRLRRAARPDAPDPWAVAGLGRPTALAADADGLWIAATGVYEVGSGVFHAPASGGLARPVALRERDIAALALGRREVCWTSPSSRELRAAPRAGGAPSRVVATHPRGFMASLAVAGDTLFASALDGPLMAVPLAGGEARALHPVEALHLAVTPGGALVFASQRAVWIARPGAVPARLADAPSLAALCVDGDHVYLADAATPRGAIDGALRRVPLDGGAAETLATGLHDPTAVALGRGRVWYTGVHDDPSARSRFRVLGSVTLRDGRRRYDEARMDVTALACDGAWLYAAGVAGGRAGGVVRRAPA